MKQGENPAQLQTRGPLAVSNKKTIYYENN